MEYLQRKHAEGKGQGKEWVPEDLRPEREWVLPSHLREKWTLRVLGGVFDSIGKVVPSDGAGTRVDDGSRGALDGSEMVVFEEEEESEEAGGGEALGDGGESNEWRMKMPKRLLMAILEDDSTVVYYIVHDGVVKPRQN
jgi:tRNA-splicing endonuclease subunit Sen15, fungi type